MHHLFVSAQLDQENQESVGRRRWLLARLKTLSQVNQEVRGSWGLNANPDTNTAAQINLAESKFLGFQQTLKPLQGLVERLENLSAEHILLEMNQRSNPRAAVKQEEPAASDGVDQKQLHRLFMEARVLGISLELTPEQLTQAIVEIKQEREQEQQREEQIQDQQRIQEIEALFSSDCLDPSVR